MKWVKKYWLSFIIVFLITANGFVWYVVWKEKPVNYFTIAFLNIGQGDAIYIESPTHNRMLVDGGPSQAILGELRKVMPFYERNIDTLLVTNPDEDHIAGFINIMRSYRVNRIIEPGTLPKSEIYKQLEKDVSNNQIEKIIGKRGMVLRLGSSTDLTILFPDRDAAKLATNDGSIISRLSYGSTSVMLTGDAPSQTEDYALDISGKENIASDILKAGHHGSKTSASENFIAAVNPKWAVISAGKRNRYGHPNSETIDIFNKFGIQTLITYEKGTIIFRCDMRMCWYVDEK